MNRTKTRKRVTVVLPGPVVEVLKGHIAKLEEDAVTRTSDLLFPSTRTGELQSRTALSKPFNAVAKALNLTKRITPRAMRRTFQDLAREAEIADVVTRAISGHATSKMQEHYSTAQKREKTESVAKVIDLAMHRKATG